MGKRWLLIAAFASSSWAAGSLSLGGRVVDNYGNPIPGAIVKLLVDGSIGTASDIGWYGFGSFTGARPVARSATREEPRIAGGFLRLRLDAPQQATVEAFDVRGGKIATLCSHVIDKGPSSIALGQGGAAARAAVVRVRLGSAETVIRDVRLPLAGGTSASLSSTMPKQPPAKRAAAIHDTIQVTHPLCVTQKQAISSYTGRTDFAMAFKPESLYVAAGEYYRVLFPYRGWVESYTYGDTMAVRWLMKCSDTVGTTSVRVALKGRIPGIDYTQTRQDGVQCYTDTNGTGIKSVRAMAGGLSLGIFKMMVKDTTNFVATVTFAGDSMLINVWSMYPPEQCPACAKAISGGYSGYFDVVGKP